MKKVNTVLFDLDGTLVDSNEIIIASYIHAYRTHLPERVPPRETVIDQIGPPLKDTFAKHTTDPDAIQKLIESYLAHYRANEHAYFRLYDGVLDVLGRLHEKRVNLAIVTSKFKEAALPSINHFGLDEYIDCLVSLDDVDEPKPSPAGVIKALDCFEDVQGALFVGDNESDIIAGKRAGILTAGVCWSIKGEAALEAVEPDYMIERMEDILAIVNNE